jgi:hypothetical protein
VGEEIQAVELHSEVLVEEPDGALHNKEGVAEPGKQRHFGFQFDQIDSHYHWLGFHYSILALPWISGSGGS